MNMMSEIHQYFSSHIAEAFPWIVDQEIKNMLSYEYSSLLIASRTICVEDVRRLDLFREYVKQVLNEFTENIEILRGMFPEICNEEIKWDAAITPENPLGNLGKWVYSASIPERKPKEGHAEL